MKKASVNLASATSSILLKKNERLYTSAFAGSISEKLI